MTTSDHRTPEPVTAGPWREASSGPRWGLRFLDFMFARLPLKGAYLLVIGLAPIWFLHYNRPRFGVVRAMRRMGSPRPSWAALRAYGAYTLSLVDRYYIRIGRLAPVVSRSGVDALDRAVAAPGPLVFLGSHCGSLEMAVPALEALGRPVRAVAVRDPASNRLLRGVGDAAASVGGGADTIVADGSVGAGLKMLKALRSGEILAFKADRHLPGSAAKDRVKVELFGEIADLPRGPAEVIRLGRARAIALSVFRVGPGRFELRFDAVPIGSGTADEIVGGYAEALQQHVAERPDQWFNFYPYWPRDREELGWLPETVPPAMRAGVWTVRGALVGAVAAALLGLAALPTALLAGLQGAFAATLMGMSIGATVDANGQRNPVARATAVLGPALAVGFMVVGLGDALTDVDLGLAALALAAGAFAANLSRVRPPPTQ